MAYDRTSAEYHLTPNGWIRGTHSYFGKSDNEIAPPEDRVETWTRDMRQASGWSKEEISWSRKWRDPEVTDEEIQALNRKYPRPE